MNANEGLTRIAKIVKWLGLLLFVGFAVAGFQNKGNFLIYLGLGIVLGLIASVIAWIIEGFAKPKD